MAIRPRTAMAPKVPQKMTLRCVCRGRFRATRPMMRALSPASTRSIRTMANRADMKAAEKNSGCMTNLGRKEGRQRGVFVDGPARRRAQDFLRESAAHPQGGEASGKQAAGEEELQQVKVAQRQH